MTSPVINYQELTEHIKRWGEALGFSQVGISDVDLSDHEAALTRWLENNYHGDMDYMARHGLMRARAKELVEGTLNVISVRMDYLPPENTDPEMVLNHPELGYISRYALGRDYHKVMRARLKKLAHKMQEAVGDFGFRVFVDSAPVLEKPIAVKAGLGWVGKHSNILNREAGSWFFLGEIYTDLVLPESEPQTDHCGRCTACIDVCPTKAIIAPYVVDARRCISYLTIELDGVIPIEFREAMGNRIYGCDDCQLICPWNRFAQETHETDYQIRHDLDHEHLLTLFAWTEQDFLDKMQGSAVRRIGFKRWQRNIAVALGNAPPSDKIINVLIAARPTSDDIVKEHIDWAIEQQQKKYAN